MTTAELRAKLNFKSAAHDFSSTGASGFGREDGGSSGVLQEKVSKLENQVKTLTKEVLL